jgi:hypothetical protein
VSLHIFVELSAKLACIMLVMKLLSLDAGYVRLLAGETYMLSFRCDMDMTSQVAYFLNLLRKIFVECNSSEESSQQSSQSEAGSGVASQESESVSQSALDSAVESQQAVVQYLQVSAIFCCQCYHCSVHSLQLFTS